MSTKVPSYHTQSLHPPGTMQPITEQLITGLEQHAPIEGGTRIPAMATTTKESGPSPLSGPGRHAGCAEWRVASVATNRRHRHRDPRGPVRIPHLGSGRGLSKTPPPVREETRTVIVFSQGAVVRLSATVSVGEMVVLTNQQTGADVLCRVGAVKTQPGIQNYVDLEFTQRAPGFWGGASAADPSARTESPASGACGANRRNGSVHACPQATATLTFVACNRFCVAVRCPHASSRSRCVIDSEYSIGS